MSNLVFSRPALPDLITRVTQQVAAGLPGVTPQVRRSTVTLLGIILSQELYQLYAYIDNFAAWFFVAQAEGVYLDRKGNPLGVLRSPGGYASAPVTFTGQNGNSVPAGAVLQTTDGSLTYTLNATVTISAGTASGAVTCTTVGSAGTLPAGASLTLVAAIAGINATVLVGAGGTPGVDRQSDDSYRQDILARLQETPQSGAGPDYVAWAKLVPGVTRVFVWPLGLSGTAAGQVTVAPVYDGRTNIIPTSGDLTNVANAIAPLKPVTATVNVIALTETSVAVTVHGLTVNTGFTLASVQANIAASIAQLSASTTGGGATFGDGIPYGTTGGFLGLDDIYEAVKQSDGVNEFDLAAPSADISSASGTISILSAPTFT